MKKTPFLAALIFFLAHTVAWANDRDFTTEIMQANTLYQNKEYSEAIRIYESLIAEGYKNGHLLYNLGNAHFRAGNTGRAIHNYLKARDLIPRDKDLQANLKSALHETTDQLDAPQGNRALLLWLDDFTLFETIKALIAINFLFWLSLAGWTYFRTGFWDLARKSALALLVLTSLCTSAKFHDITHHVSGVILANTVDVKSTPVSDAVTLFQLHEGAVVSVIETKDGWLKIELADEKSGWVNTTSVGI